MRDIIGDGGIRAIAGMVIAYALTNFIYLVLMVSVFTLMTEKFDPRFFEVPIYSGYWVIFKRQTLVILVVTIFLLIIISAWLAEKYSISPVAYLAAILFIVLFVKIFSSIRYRFSGSREEITSGPIFDGYRELLRKSGMSHIRLWIKESADGTAEIKTTGFFPHLNEIVLTKPLVEGLDGSQAEALIARELYLIKKMEQPSEIFCICNQYANSLVHVDKKISCNNCPRNNISLYTDSKSPAQQTGE